jgi:RHS repeat-associated protein
MNGAYGLFLMGMRSYDPGTGQFNSNDPLGLDGGSANIRSYVGNNPTDFIDPQGTRRQNTTNPANGFVIAKTPGGWQIEGIHINVASPTNKQGAQAVKRLWIFPGSASGFAKDTAKLFGANEKAATLLEKQIDKHIPDTNPFSGVDLPNPDQPIAGFGPRIDINVPFYGRPNIPDQQAVWKEVQHQFGFLQSGYNGLVKAIREVQKPAPPTNHSKAVSSVLPKTVIAPKGTGAHNSISSKRPVTVLVPVSLPNIITAITQTASTTMTSPNLPPDTNLDVIPLVETSAVGNPGAGSTPSAGTYDSGNGVNSYGTLSSGPPTVPGANLSPAEQTQLWDEFNQPGAPFEANPHNTDASIIINGNGPNGSTMTIDFAPDTSTPVVPQSQNSPMSKRLVGQAWGPMSSPSPQQEEYLLLSFGLNPNLPTGTILNVQFTITFGVSAPIVLPALTYTIDNTPPTSTVNPLPSTSRSTVTVSWSGQASEGAGIASYNVYVSDNGGPCTTFLANTTATSAQFTGQAGHTYSFYSIAIDNVGNVQTVPGPVQSTKIAGPALHRPPIFFAAD